MTTRSSLCLLLTMLAACGDNIVPGTGGDGGIDGNANRDAATDAVQATTPTVLSNRPATGAPDVAINTNVGVTFSEPMDRSTLNGTTFTLTVGNPEVAVTGSVVARSTSLEFWPSAMLLPNTTYRATVTVGAKSAAQVALATPHTWTFMTGTSVAPGIPVNLGTAGNFVILAKSGITTVPTSAVTGDLGVSPIAATAIIGFDLTADATNVFSTSAQVTGKIYAANYAAPTPSNLTTAVSDMEIAFTDAAARAPDADKINLGAGTIGSITLAPGVYKWGTDLLIPTSVMLSGSATDVWIFQIAGNLTVANGVAMTLAGSALAKNIFWQVGGEVTSGTTSHLEGVVLSQTAITLDTGASINGRLLAQTAVTIRASTVVQPAP
ncbi:MAG: ice-binding family protein [Myxococcota bacterium]|nr:ice-binding family protein [Myxococcota bacterium]